MTPEEPRYSIKQVLWMDTLGVTLGLFAGTALLYLMGAVCRLILIVVVLFYPIFTFIILRSFYLSLVKYYGLKDNRNQPERGQKSVDQVGYQNVNPDKEGAVTPEEPRYSIKQVLWMDTLGVTLGLFAGTALLYLMGADCRLIAVVVVLLYPIVTFIILKSFYLSLVKYYGFKVT